MEVAGPGAGRLRPVTHVAFFGHNAYDAAVRRRAIGFAQDGLEVTGFMMRREGEGALLWRNVDLGRTFDGNYLQRLKSIWTGARIAARHRTELAKADVIYARNLDMVMCAFLARRLAGLKAPVIYECLDIHHLLTRTDLAGSLMRWWEGRLLKGCAAVVISSPGFERDYFQVRHPGKASLVLVENRRGRRFRAPAQARRGELEGPVAHWLVRQSALSALHRRHGSDQGPSR